MYLFIYYFIFAEQKILRLPVLFLREIQKKEK